MCLLCRESSAHQTSAKHSTEHDPEWQTEGKVCSLFCGRLPWVKVQPPPLQVSWCRDGLMGIADKASWRIGLGKGGGALQLLYIWLEEASKRKRLDVCCRSYSLFSLFPLSLQAADRGAVTDMPSVAKPLRHTCAPRGEECQSQQPFRQSLLSRQTLFSRVDCQRALLLLRSGRTGAWATALTTKDVVYVSCWSVWTWHTNSGK